MVENIKGFSKPLLSPCSSADLLAGVKPRPLVARTAHGGFHGFVCLVLVCPGLDWCIVARRVGLSSGGPMTALHGGGEIPTSLMGSVDLASLLGVAGLGSGTRTFLTDFSLHLPPSSSSSCFWTRSCFNLLSPLTSDLLTSHTCSDGLP